MAAELARPAWQLWGELAALGPRGARDLTLAARRIGGEATADEAGAGELPRVLEAAGLVAAVPGRAPGAPVRFAAVLPGAVAAGSPGALHDWMLRIPDAAQRGRVASLLPPWPGTLLAGLPGRGRCGARGGLGSLLRGRDLAEGRPVAAYAWAGVLTPARMAELREKGLAGLLANGTLVGRGTELPPLDKAAVAAWGQALPDPAQRAAVLGQLGLPACLPPPPARR